MAGSQAARAAGFDNPSVAAGAATLSKAQRAIIRYFARSDAETSLFTGMALRHNASQDAGYADPYSKSLGARDALVDLLLRSIYDRPYLSVLGPVVATVLYLVVLVQAGLLLASFLRGHP